MSDVIASISSWIKHAMRYAKHWVLDYAHPLPPSVRVYAPDPTDVRQRMVRDLIAYMDWSGVAYVEEGATEPMLWVDGDDGVDGVDGAFAIVRYLGRLWRLHPVSPEGALLVDSTLEMLDSYVCAFADGPVRDASEHAHDLVRDLCERLHGDDYLEGFMHPTVADVCAVSLLHHALEQNDVDVLYDPKTQQNFHTWWTRMTQSDPVPDVSESEKKER